MKSYKIGSRIFTFYKSSLQKEFTYKKNKNYLFCLSNLSILSIYGKQSFNMLQSQLTCNLNKINLNLMQKGTICNERGQISSCLDIIFWKNFHLILSNDMLKEVNILLKVPALLSNVKIKNQNKYYIYGFYLVNKQDLLPFHSSLLLNIKQNKIIKTKNLFCYPINKKLFILIIYKKNKDIIINDFKQSNQIKGSLSWHRLQIENKIFSICKETTKIFTPNKLNLLPSQYISLNKGCYKGQEIINKLFYKSKKKYFLKHFIIKKKDKPFPGKKFFDLKNIELGKFVDICPISYSKYLTLVSINTNKKIYSIKLEK
ncbi:hypothetical protein CCU22_00140 [Candidatus Legionella polyplacis]|uniref:Glycine cleavage T protein n=1 Tax=Candidatus Legionella polyplacis TaxID=2005262 RepID=A0ABZ2H0G0_9GAMM|nr:hypothetical protein [Candidatus Legionella polyplacis]ATW01649.1 hypothetical protein CCU22_00140 [Candidatus Legionella polyplacis]